MGARPPNIFLGVGAKNWKIAKNRDRCIQFWAYNSGTEANFWTLKTAVEPQDNGLQGVRLTLTFDPRGKHSARFCMYKCKNSRLLGDSLNIFCSNPHPTPKTFTVNSPRGALKVCKILWILTHKRRWTIRLKHWEFLLSAVYQQRFSGTVSPPGERGCVKKTWTRESI